MKQHALSRYMCLYNCSLFDIFMVWFVLVQGFSASIETAFMSEKWQMGFLIS